MKKYLSVLGLVVVLIIGWFFIAKNKLKPNPQNPTDQTQKILQPQEEKEEGQKNSKAVSLIEGKLYNLCELFSKEKIEELSGKTIVAIEPKSHKELDFNQYSCTYYQEEAKYSEVAKGVNIAKNINIAVIAGKTQIKRAQEGYEMLKYTTQKDKDIPFNHLLIYDEKGKFHHLDLLLTDDYKITVETWWSLLSDEEALQFVKKFALYFKELAENKTENQNQTPSPTSISSSEEVPLPQEEDIIRNFVSFIEGGNPDKAAQMMKTNSETEMQAWAVQFAAINSFKLLKMEKANENQWTNNKHIYKVLLDVWMDPRSADAPIPYYGWENGQNTRWLTLEKVYNTWKIAAIASGP